MKRLMIAALSTLAFSSLAVPVLADELVKVSSPAATDNIVEITPFDLVTGSYQGLYQDQGIPSSGSFLTAIRADQIQAVDLVQGAIAKGRLSEATLNDPSYLNRVQSLLDGLERN
jgi:hypothetical protein